MSLTTTHHRDALLRDALTDLCGEDAARYVLETDDPGAALAVTAPTPDSLTPAQARRLSHLRQLLVTLADDHARSKDLLDRPEAIHRLVRVCHWREDQEVMGACYLDCRHRLLATDETFRGTLTRAAVEPRQLLRRGLALGAAGLVLWHTHPSGDPSPSAEDLAFTRRLSEAGEIVGVRLVDHIIAGTGGRFVSLRRQGAF